jgi:hypothetical protein
VTALRALSQSICRLIRPILWVTCVLFILVVVAGGGLLWRLSAGPVPIHFLTPYLEDALATALGGRQIHVQQTIVAWDVGAKSLELQARQVTVGESSAPRACLVLYDVWTTSDRLSRYLIISKISTF